MLTTKEINKALSLSRAPFIALKFGARGYQGSYIENIFSSSKYVAVLSGPTGSGKSYTIKMVINHIDVLVNGKRSCTIVEVPDNFQGILTNLFNTLEELNNDQIGFITTSSINKGIMNGSSINKMRYFRNSYVINETNINISEWSAHYKHIVVLTSYHHLRKTIINELINSPAMKDRIKTHINDEIHFAKHSSEAEIQEQSRGLAASSWSEKGCKSLKDLLAAGFRVVGFTGTESGEQGGRVTGADELFKFYDLTEEQKIEVAIHNSPLLSVEYFGTTSITGSRAGAVNFMTQHLERKYSGVCLCYCGNVLSANSGLSKTEMAKRMDPIQARKLIKDKFNVPFLVWLGGNKKTLHWKENGKWHQEDIIKDIQDILVEHSDIRFIVVNALLSTGFDYPNVNTICFLKPVLNDIEPITQMQQIGRGVRKGLAPLVIGFMGVSSRVEGNHFDENGKIVEWLTPEGQLIEKIIEKKMVLWVDDHEEACKNFTPPAPIEILPNHKIEKIIDHVKYDIEDLKMKLNNYLICSIGAAFKVNASVGLTSTVFSNTIENYIGSHEFGDPLEDYPRVDGMMKFSDTIRTFDDMSLIEVKSFLEEVEGTPTYSDSSRAYITLKDKTKGDGLPNIDVPHLIFVTSVINQKINSAMYIVQLPKGFKSRSISLKMVKEIGHKVPII